MRSREAVLREMEKTLTEWANILSVQFSVPKEKKEINRLLRSYIGKRGIFLNGSLATGWATQMRGMVADIQWILRQRRKT